MSMAMLATPPVAPVTSTGPRSGVKPLCSIQCSARPAVWLGGQAVFSHPGRRRAGVVAGRAQYCGLQQRQAPGQGQHPVARDTGPLRMAAVMVYADAKAV